MCRLFYPTLGIPEIPKDETVEETAYAKRVKKMAKHHSQQKLQESWEEKTMTLMTNYDGTDIASSDKK